MNSSLFILPILTWMLHSGVATPPGPIDSEVASGDQHNYGWIQITSSAEFTKSYNFQLFDHDHHLWAFHHSGVWISENGQHWKRTSLTDAVENQGFLDYVRFKGAVYALGTFKGNIERFTQTTRIARTTDFAHWEILARESNLPKRFFYHPFVFQDRLWIVGGEDKEKKYSDAWTSTDAIHWSKVADKLPFGDRAGQRFLEFNGKLYMLAHDVWVSSDGIHWTLLTPKIADGDIFGYSAEVFDGMIWLIGCNRSGQFRSEVLYSSDGLRWKAERAPWSPRGGVATCVFNNQIIMTGGKYGGPGIAGQTEFVYSNDVWALRRQ